MPWPTSVISSSPMPSPIRISTQTAGVDECEQRVTESHRSCPGAARKENRLGAASMRSWIANRPRCGLPEAPHTRAPAHGSPGRAKPSPGPDFGGRRGSGRNFLPLAAVQLRPNCTVPPGSYRSAGSYN